VFAERGYHGASMEEIAARSGVSPPVVYDHFESKRDLHGRLLERHFGELRAVWRDSMEGDAPAERRIAAAFDAWFAYVEHHPYAWRMLFRETTGEPEVEALHREVAAQSRAALLPLLAGELDLGSQEAVEMAWEALRGVLQGLASWWYEHRQVPRSQVVAMAMNSFWIGFDRVLAGDSWEAGEG
jgi:AcrR family transcriptional regulator